MMNHVGAGARRRYNEIAVFKSQQQCPGGSSRFLPIAAIIGRLAAACLRFGKINLYPVPRKYANDRFTDLRIYDIAQASNK
ncbi:hypothetical protein D3C77_648480 [compost metagenome]